MLPHVHFPLHEHSAASSSSSAGAASSPDAAAASATPAAAAAASSAPLSFAFTSTARRAAPSVAAALGAARASEAAAAAKAQADRHVISGALTAGSLAAAHRRAEQQAAGGLGAKGLVIPLIKQTQWRGAGGAAGTAAAAASSSAAALPASHPSMLSTAGVAELKARDATGSKSAGIAFESEQDLMDQAYAEKQAARAAAAAAAAAASADDLPALQTVAETAVPMSLDEEAAAALLNDAASMPRSAPALPSAEQQEAFARAAPILIANALPGNNKMLSEEERLALDVDLRPDEATLEDYARVPISEFGAGMLRGMGWAGLGDPIGGINKAVCEPVQFAARGERMGLGATFAKVKDKDNRAGKRILKPGETREAVGVVRVGGAAAASSSGGAAGPTAAELKAKSLRSLGSRLIQVHSQQLRVGALVEIMDGPHRRSYAKIVSFADPASVAHVDDVAITVRLNLSGEVVDLLRGQVEILDERAIPDDHPAFETAEGRAKRIERENKEMAARGAQRDERKEDAAAGSKRDRSSRTEDDASNKKHRSDRDRDRSRDRDRDRSSSKRSRSRERRDHHSSSSSSRHASSSAHSSSSHSSSAASASSAGPPRWVRAHIRVRIVSSSFAGGAYYNTKGTVVDVSSSAHILVRPDGGGKIIEGLAERQLESVIPPAGQARVMILRGEHRGSVGKLIQKQTDKARAVVQMEEDLNILTVDFDDISEYVA